MEKFQKSTEDVLKISNKSIIDFNTFFRK